ncbi:hypothetical protein AKJ16_DCAP09597 [Drosera capensis]
MAVRPEASIPSVTCSAADEDENPDGPFLLKKPVCITSLRSLFFCDSVFWFRSITFCYTKIYHNGVHFLGPYTSAHYIPTVKPGPVLSSSRRLITPAISTSIYTIAADSLLRFAAAILIVGVVV